VVAPLLRIQGIEKRFGATCALAGVSFEVQCGEIHALLGENGAGKSTLMNILYGAVRPDTGTLELASLPYRPNGPSDARRHGVAMVHQEPLLCPDLTVHENLLLGNEPSRFGLLSKAEANRRVSAALIQVKSDDEPEAIAPDRLARTLSPSERQLVAIARALATENCRLLILDEPTSSLTEAEVRGLFRVLERLASNGLSVIYISHFLEEVRQVARRFTVLRDGQSITSGAVAETTNDELVQLMVGRTIAELFPTSKRTAGRVVLSLQDLAGGTKHEGARLESAALELRAGEVLGIFGLVGSGRTELLRAIFGLDAVRRGEIRVKAHTGAASPAERWSQGVGFGSEDRKSEGLSEKQSLAENLTLTRLRGLGPFGLVFPWRMRAIAERFVRELRIRANDVGRPVGELSGGNQQKVALARLLYHQADVLLLDEPTRGIDVRSRAEVYAIINQLSQQGAAVLMVSSYLPELFGVCDRVQVMRRGRLGDARPVRELEAGRVLSEAIG
jgi:ribose transport system ATP-binding protein